MTGPLRQSEGLSSQQHGSGHFSSTQYRLKAPRVCKICNNKSALAVTRTVISTFNRRCLPHNLDSKHRKAAKFVTTGLLDCLTVTCDRIFSATQYRLKASQGCEICNGRSALVVHKTVIVTTCKRIRTFSAKDYRLKAPYGCKTCDVRPALAVTEGTVIVSACTRLFPATGYRVKVPQSWKSVIGRSARPSSSFQHVTEHSLPQNTCLKYRRDARTVTTGPLRLSQGPSSCQLVISEQSEVFVRCNEAFDTHYSVGKPPFWILALYRLTRKSLKTAAHI